MKINMMSRGSVRTGTKKRGSIITRLRHITRTRNRNGRRVRSSEGGDEEPSMADPLLLLSHHSPAVHRIPTMGADALELGETFRRASAGGGGSTSGSGVVRIGRERKVRAKVEGGVNLFRRKTEMNGKGRRM